jgi:hypothetical protein
LKTETAFDIHHGTFTIPLPLIPPSIGSPPSFNSYTLSLHINLLLELYSLDYLPINTSRAFYIESRHRKTPC